MEVGGRAQKWGENGAGTRKENRKGKERKRKSFQVIYISILLIYF